MNSTNITGMENARTMPWWLWPETSSGGERIVFSREPLSDKKFRELHLSHLGSATGNFPVAFQSSPGTIFLTEPFNPGTFFSAVSSWECHQGNERFSSSEINPNEIVFETCLKEDEVCITGWEKLRRLQNASPSGGDVFLGLWKDYLQKKENNEKDKSVLEWLCASKGIRYLDFFHDILHSNGLKAVLCLQRFFDGSWYYFCRNLDEDWQKDHLSAVIPIYNL
jgi:hypothetical protein